MELASVMPGIDVRRDVLDVASMRIVLPERAIPVVPTSVVTGRGFAPRLGH
jgi:acyl CoA:acetate/3-ketoacid CoA transferase